MVALIPLGQGDAMDTGRTIATGDPEVGAAGATAASGRRAIGRENVSDEPEEISGRG